MATIDDVPWPELGNVSRGATRGNQGQKGVLGPPDRDGQCILQLRVQPNVLAVRLNRQASDWYRMLDNEVNRALKLTKTFWRKARRRQSYDARADQDHMELHEWLQQLKDKTMSHLELLMQKGDIQGPPYVMPDEIELTFLRKFVERQAAGIPHNPRLRNGLGETAFTLRDNSVDSASSEPSDHGYVDQQNRLGIDASESTANHLLQPSRLSPTLHNPESLAQEASTSKQALQMSREAMARAQKETQDAFLRYTACLDAERQARQSVVAAEKRRDDIMAALLSLNQTTADQQSRHSSVSLDDQSGVPRYHPELQQNTNDLKSARSNVKPMDWPDSDTTMYGGDTVPHLDDRSMHRKHSRTWENGGQLTDQYACEVLDLTGLPPRKRMHHMIPGYDVMGTPVLQAQNLSLQS